MFAYNAPIAPPTTPRAETLEAGARIQFRAAKDVLALARTWTDEDIADSCYRDRAHLVRHARGLWRRGLALRRRAAILRAMTA